MSKTLDIQRRCTHFTMNYYYYESAIAQVAVETP